MAVDCDCGLCRPDPDVRTHPVYGYDLDKAKETPCLMCAEPIGDETYVEDLAWARWGQMHLVHARCESESARKSRLKMEKHWLPGGKYYEKRIRNAQTEDD